SGGCVSASRASVTITVLGAPPVATGCNIPVNQTWGVSPLLPNPCLLCSVIDPQNSIDNNPDNYTRLSIPVGLLDGYVYQTLIFPSAGAASDSIRLTLASPGGLVDVSLLGGVRIIVYNGTTQVSAHDASSLLTLRLLGGTGRYMATVPA